MSAQYSNQRAVPSKFTKGPGPSAPKAAAASGDKKGKPTTHYLMKAGENVGDTKELVRGVFITETKFGLMVSVTEGLEQGLYFVNKRKPAAGTSNQYAAE